MPGFWSDVCVTAAGSLASGVVSWWWNQGPAVHLCHLPSPTPPLLLWTEFLGGGAGQVWSLALLLADVALIIRDLQLSSEGRWIKPVGRSTTLSLTG